MGPGPRKCMLFFPLHCVHVQEMVQLSASTASKRPGESDRNVDLRGETEEGAEGVMRAGMGKKNNIVRQKERCYRSRDQARMSKF